MSTTPFRIGLAGAGTISTLHLEGMLRHPERARPVALMDPDQATLQRRAQEYGIDQTYTDLSDLIDHARLDAAVVCTPTPVRADVVIPLLEAGIPVFCEKPFAETYAEARRIADASAATGVPVAVNQNFRRHFAFAVVRDHLARGDAGKPLHLTQISKYIRHDTGWRLDRDRYVMSVMTIHWLDAYRWLFNEEPYRIYVRGVNSPATEGGKDTAISLILEFPSGIVVSLSESFSSFAGGNCCSLDCERASYELDYGQARLCMPGKEKVELRNPMDKADATYHLLDDLLDAVENGRDPETSAADNLKSMRLLEAAYRSLETGLVVNPKEIAE